MKKTALLAVAALSLATAGCIEFTQKTTAPSTDLRQLAGTWSSGTIVQNAQNCTNFNWNVTEYTGTTAKGTFSATCPGDLKLNGSAEGRLTGSVIHWSAAGIASAPSLPSCAISLNGTAVLKESTVEVPYTGNTCLGPVSGTEILKKR